MTSKIISCQASVIGKYVFLCPLNIALDLKNIIMKNPQNGYGFCL
jgi:hypothetical protein